ncbi:MAG: ArsR family transcriptional regulator [Chloroflexi bacterium]|nr:ArsR family transcriptional regulator [Chloroflexota bacterium]
MGVRSVERTRDELVQLLAERGECSVAELASEIGVSAGSVRRHLDILVAEGMLVSRLERQGRGRPLARYSLSARAEEHTSSEHYQRLLARLSPALQSLPAATEGRSGSDLMDQLFEQVAHAVADEHRAQVNGRTLPERVTQTLRVLSSEGILHDVEDAGEFFRLRNSGCPFRSTAAETHACCSADRRAIELLLGVPVEQVTTVAAGGHECEYLVRKEDGPGEAAGGLLPVMGQRRTGMPLGGVR